MDLGSLDIQIFVSLVVVLGAAFVALVCDYLKGNNEQLREKNVELRVRSEEREHRWLLDPGTLIPQTLFQQFFAAARQAGWTPEAVAQTAQKAAINPRRAAAAPPPEPSRVDLEALRRRNDSFDFRAEDQKREKVAEAQPVAARLQRKSAEDFVSPEVLAKVAIAAAPVLAAVAATENPDSANHSLTAIALAPETEEAVTVTAEATKSTAGSNVFAVGDSVRGEIQRLKEQAKAKFASQPSAPPLEESKETVHIPQNAEEEDLGDLVVGLNLEEQLQHVSIFGFDPDDQERLPAESAAQLQLEIERVATIYGIEKPVDKRTPPPVVIQPEHQVPGLELQQELHRIVTPADGKPMSIGQGLLDQIIRASVESSSAIELPGQVLESGSSSNEDEQLVELAYLNVENTENSEHNNHSLSFSYPTAGNLKSGENQEADHGAILRELLRQKEDLTIEETLVEEPAVSNHAEPSITMGLDRLTASVSELEPPQSFFEGDSLSLETVQELSLPLGLHDKNTLAQLMDTGKCVSGVVIYAGLNDYAKLIEGKTKPQIDEFLHPATKLITSIVRDKDFAARVSEDTWLMVFRGELGNAAQRRIDAVSEKFWDFQLRNLGQVSLTFSSGAVQVEKEPLADAVAAAKERMEQLRHKGKVNASGGRKKAVNS